MTSINCSSQIPVYVISLGSAKKRREEIEKKLSNIEVEFTFFEAVNGKDPEVLYKYSALIDENWTKKRKGDPLRPAEIGCALSHALLYEKLIKSGISDAVILEDDSDPQEGFADFVNRKFPEDVYGNLTILHVHSRQFALKRKVAIENGFGLYEPYDRFLGACGYYLNSKAAHELLSAALPIWTVADWPMNLGQTLGARGLEPPIVNQSSNFESQVQVYANRSTPLSVILMRLLVVPTLFDSERFGSPWKSLYAWQAILKRVKVKLFARRPVASR